jgi:hypothetical protein
MVLVVEFDMDELACRILEAHHEMSRPDNMSATEALDEMPLETQNDYRRCAMVAMEYFEEQVNAGHSVS